MNRKQRRRAARKTSSRDVRSVIAAAQHHHASGRLVEATAGYSAALRVNPNNTECLIGLAFLRFSQNDSETAERLLQKAIQVDPKSSKARYVFGVMLADNDAHLSAVEAFRHSLDLDPNNIECQMQLGISLYKTGHCSDAANCFRRVIEAEPDNVGAYNNLGMSLQDQCLIDEANIAYRQAVTLMPDYQGARSNLLFCMNYAANCTPQDIFKEHVQWGKTVAVSDKALMAVPLPDPDTGRRLRIGYVSPDFRRHSVAYFFEPLLARHDKTATEIFCYAEVARPNEVTTRLRNQADHWFSTVGVADNVVAEKIRADKIDILVDLAGHTRDNRLPVFAFRPAPVQVTWLGYPNTTGLPAMDFRITDQISDPSDSADDFMTETPIRLPDGFLCYRPNADAPEIVDPPCKSQGHITFGSFNNLAKLSSTTIELWADLLRRVSGARLIIKGKGLADTRTRDRILHTFEKAGVQGDRLDLMSLSPITADHLSLYGKVDIALDTFPYNGTTTTCEALWMGVPVITLFGDRHAARVGASILEQIGTPEWIATTEAGYIEMACTLAGDIDGLTDLRHQLRDKMLASPLMDDSDFTRKMEAAFHLMIELKRNSIAQK